ncbi:hypothetical protein IJ670_06720 [bacterium]|nr:hypothetical protein [bacterium]
MVTNRNERCLLRFIAGFSKDNELLETIVNFGITPKFKDDNNIYQIIDELHYSKYLEGRV